MKECFSKEAADVIDKISNCEKLSNRELAWVERALTLDYVHEQILIESLGLDYMDIFGLRMQPHKNNKRQT